MKYFHNYKMDKKAGPGEVQKWILSDALNGF
jgi:hypothetical protein